MSLPESATELLQSLGLNTCTLPANSKHTSVSNAIRHYVRNASAQFYLNYPNCLKINEADGTAKARDDLLEAQGKDLFKHLGREADLNPQLLDIFVTCPYTRSVFSKGKKAAISGAPKKSKPKPPPHRPYNVKPTIEGDDSDDGEQPDVDVKDFLPSMRYGKKRARDGNTDQLAKRQKLPEPYTSDFPINRFSTPLTIRSHTPMVRETPMRILTYTRDEDGTMMLGSTIDLTQPSTLLPKNLEATDIRAIDQVTFAYIPICIAARYNMDFLTRYDCFFDRDGVVGLPRYAFSNPVHFKQWDRATGLPDPLCIALAPSTNPPVLPCTNVVNTGDAGSTDSTVPGVEGATDSIADGKKEEEEALRRKEEEEALRRKEEEEALRRKEEEEALRRKEEEEALRRKEEEEALRRKEEEEALRRKEEEEALRRREEEEALRRKEDAALKNIINSLGENNKVKEERLHDEQMTGVQGAELPEPFRNPSARPVRAQSPIDLTDDSIDENMTGENTTGENATGENATGENATDENATDENATDENATNPQNTLTEQETDSPPVDDFFHNVNITNTGEDDDQNVDQYLDSITELPVRTQLTPDLVAFSCDLLGLDKSSWDPQGFISLPFIHASRRPRAYQVHSAIMILKLEVENQTTRDIKLPGNQQGSLSYHMGGTLAHQCGLGKTYIVILAWALGLLLTSLKQDCKERREKGKPIHTLDEVRAGYGMNCCDCRVPSPTLLLPMRQGATMVICPHVVLPDWQKAVDGAIDLGKLQSMTGFRQIQVAVGHGEASKVYKRFDLVVGDWKTRDVTPSDEMNPLPAKTNESWIRARLSGAIQPQNMTPANGLGLLILTSPKSFNSQVYTKIMSYNLAPCPSSAQPVLIKCCDNKGRCIANPAVPDYAHERGKHPASHYITQKTVPSGFGQTVISLLIGRIFIDESHKIGKNDGLMGLLGKLCQTQSTFPSQLTGPNSMTSTKPTVWGVTGTPMDSLATHPLYALQLNEVKGVNLLTLSPDSQPLSESEFDRLCSVDKMMRDLHVTAITANALMDVQGTRDWSPRKVRDYTDEKRASALKKIWREDVLPVLTMYVRRFMIRIRADDKWGPHRMLALPPLVYRDHPCRFTPKYKDLLLPFAKGVRESLTAKEDIDQTEVMNATRHFQIILQVPALIDILSDKVVGKDGAKSTQSVVNMEKGLSRVIKEGNWFDKPRLSPYWPLVDRMLDSSPKLQFILEKLMNGEPETSTIRAMGKGDVGSIQFKHPRKFVIACTEPAVALSVYCLLQDKATTTSANPGPYQPSEIQALHTGTKDRAALIDRFQMGLNSTDPLDPSLFVHVMVLCTRLGAEGITLNTCHEMIMVDVDRDNARAKQVPARCHRYGVEHSVKFTQLQQDDFGWDPRLLQGRRENDKAIDSLETQGGSE